jgi:hypothetical protein
MGVLIALTWLLRCEGSVREPTSAKNHRSQNQATETQKD